MESENREAQEARKEFAKIMMEKFTFEELAKLVYSGSCALCSKCNCMGVDSVKECAEAIREKYEADQDNKANEY